MANVIVNGRVPVAKKEASASILERLGVTTTDLINSAYDYLLETGELPAVTDGGASREADFVAFLDRSSCAVDWGEDASLDYKDIIERERVARYESLA